MVVIAARGDALFPLDYLREVYERIVAPAKELLVFELDTHLLFNEHLEAVLPRLVEKLAAYAPAASRAPEASPPEASRRSRTAFPFPDR